MVPMAAEILTEEVMSDGRAAVRRSLRLAVRAYRPGDQGMALILNISETGLLLETAVPLAIDELLRIELPEGSASTVRVVWREKLQAGCEFDGSLSRAAVSAALLKAQADAFSSPEPAAAYDGSPEEASVSAVMIVSFSVAFLALIILLAAVFPLL